MSYGRIVAAGIEVDGSELSSDHLVGVTILDLEDALDFLEPEVGETVQVRIIADDDTEELVTIKVPETEDEDTVDDEDGFLHLAAPTVNAYSEGTRVEVYPETRRLIALVRLDDAEEDSETVDAIVDDALVEKIPENTELNIAVEMDYDGEAYTVTNILGEHPEMEIVAGTFKTATEGERVEIGRDEPDRISFHTALADDVASIRVAAVGDLSIQSTTGSVLLIAKGLNADVQVIDAPLKIGVNLNSSNNALLIRAVSDYATIPTPPSGYVAIAYNSATGLVFAKDSSGITKRLNEVPF